MWYYFFLKTSNAANGGAVYVCILLKIAKQALINFNSVFDGQPFFAWRPPNTPPLSFQIKNKVFFLFQMLSLSLGYFLFLSYFSLTEGYVMPIMIRLNVRLAASSCYKVVEKGARFVITGLDPKLNYVGSKNRINTNNVTQIFCQVIKTIFFFYE